MASETKATDGLSPEYLERLKGIFRDVGGGVAAELVTEHLSKLEGNGRKPNGHGMLTNPLGGDYPTERAPRPGIALARAALCAARAHIMEGKGTAVDHAKRMYGEDSDPVKILQGTFRKAMQADDLDAGGSLLVTETDPGIIAALAPLTVIRSLGAMTLPNPTGSLNIRQITGNPTFGWAGEGQNFQKTEAATGVLSVTAKRLGGVVPVSNDLIRYGGPEVEESIRQAILTGLRVGEDSAFVRGAGTGGAPKGVRNWADAGQVFVSTAGTTPGAVTLAAVTFDLLEAIQHLLDANVDPDAMGGAWIFAPRTWRYLAGVRDGNGNQVFVEELNRGTLFGYPFRRTTQIPTNLDTSGEADNDESEVIFAAMRHIRVYDSPGAEVRAFDGGAYHDGSNVQSGISLDETAIRAQLRSDLVAEHREAVSVITQVVWGAP